MADEKKSQKAVREIEHLIEKGARQVTQGQVDRSNPPQPAPAQNAKVAQQSTDQASVSKPKE